MNNTLPTIKNLLTPFQAQLKYAITEIELMSITGSDLIVFNRDVTQKYKSDDNYNIIDDFEFADKLLMKYVKFTYNEQVSQKVFNGNSDIERFQTSHFSEYIEIAKLYLEYIVYNLQSINSLMNKKVMKDEAELMQLALKMFSEEDQIRYKQQLLQNAKDAQLIEDNKKKV